MPVLHSFGTFPATAARFLQLLRGCGGDIRPTRVDELGSKILAKIKKATFRNRSKDKKGVSNFFRKTKKDSKNILTTEIVCVILALEQKRSATHMKMTASEIAKEIMKASGVSQKKLADKMNLKAQQAVFNLLNAKNGMRTDSFVKMMNALGYDVIVRNRVNDTEMQVFYEGSGNE